MNALVPTVSQTATPRGEPLPFEGRPPTAAETRACALARFDDDPDFLERIVPLFRQAAVEQAQALGAAIDARDARQVQHWAHTLKGSLLTVGASATAARTEAIERAAGDGRIEGLRAPVRQVIAETMVIAAQLGGDPASMAR